MSKRKGMKVIPYPVVDQQEVERYMALPYHIILTPFPKEDGEGWFAEIAEFKGSATDGPTQAEALADLRIVQREWIEIHLGMGNDIPLPMAELAFAH